MSDYVPSWMPSDEEIDATLLTVDREHDRVYIYEEGSPVDAVREPIRALIRAAVEKALEEQEARHRREVLEARIEEIGKGLHVLQSGGVASGTAHGPEFSAGHCAFCRNIGALRAELAALDSNPREEQP